MENWKEIFRDDNEWNEKSIIGFIAFMFLLMILFLDLIFAICDDKLELSKHIYDILLWLIIGCFGISGLQKFTKK
jgi:hypothetical protein